MSDLHQRTNSRSPPGAMTKEVGAANGATPAASGGGLSMEVKLVLCVLGIYFCYMSSGMLQENIFIYRTEDGSGRFSSTLFLLWVQCVVNVVFAYLAMQAYGRSGDKMPQHLFGTAGFAYIGAMVCSIEALKYVNFPTKELGKSCKMIPVMLFGVLFAKKKYGLRDYFCVALITAGIVTFNLNGKSHNKKDKENSAYGLTLLALSLILDGVTGSAQERLKAACKPTVHEMMFFMNAWALAILSATAYATGQWTEGMAFCSAHPSVMTYVLGFSLAAAFGQNFIYYTISNFNPLVCTTITTTRKFFTIMCSVLVHGHPITSEQWCGVGMVFTGIGLEMRGKYQKNKEKQLKAKS